MFTYRLIALAALGAGLFFAGAQASAFPVPKPAVETTAASPLLTDVSHRDWRRDRHGDRWRYRHHRYRYYHGGYWYDNPWWILPMVGAGIVIGNRDRYDDGYGSGNVEWCLNRYRSYDVRTNTWVSYSGRVRQCISPYMR